MSFGVCLSTIYLLIWRLKTGGPPRDFGVIFEGLFFSKRHFERDIPFLIEGVIRCNKWHQDLPSIFSVDSQVSIDLQKIHQNVAEGQDKSSQWTGEKLEKVQIKERL